MSGHAEVDPREAGFMARALVLARRGLHGARPNPAVGCVLVAGGRIVGEGFHERAGGPHAEIRALGAAGPRARGATCYVTLEPCAHHGRTPPCVDELLEAGVARVVAAMHDPNPAVAGAGLAALAARGVAVEVGLLAAAARGLNPGFVSRMSLGRPHTRVKLAASLDGRTALATGESQWITAAAARRDVQRLRARCGAVLTGIETVLADDPRLTVREGPELPSQPMRVVLDSRLRLPPGARVLREDGETVVVTTSPDAPARARLEAAGARVVCLEPRHGRVPLGAALEWLAGAGVNDLLVEAGPTLSGALLEAGVVDELIVYLAPKLLGHDGRALIELTGLARLDAAPRVEVAEIRRVGEDLRVTALPRPVG